MIIIIWEKKKKVGGAADDILENVDACTETISSFANKASKIAKKKNNEDWECKN